MDFNKNGFEDKEDLILMEEMDHDYNKEKKVNTTLPTIVVGVIMLVIFLFIRFH